MVVNTSTGCCDTSAPRPRRRWIVDPPMFDAACAVGAQTATRVLEHRVSIKSRRTCDLPEPDRPEISTCSCCDTASWIAARSALIADQRCSISCLLVASGTRTHGLYTQHTRPELVQGEQQPASQITHTDCLCQRIGLLEKYHAMCSVGWQCLR